MIKHYDELFTAMITKHDKDHESAREAKVAEWGREFREEQEGRCANQ